MLSVLFPGVAYIVPLQKVFDEIATRICQKLNLHSRNGSLRCEWQGVGRVEVIDRSTALADVGAGSYTSLDILIRCRYGPIHGHSLRKVACNGSCLY